MSYITAKHILLINAAGTSCYHWYNSSETQYRPVKERQTNVIDQELQYVILLMLRVTKLDFALLQW